MASSQTSYFTEKRKESIIDGRLFVQYVVMDRVEAEKDDVAAMEHVVSRIKQTGLYNLGRQHSEVFDESLVEEFYKKALVCFHSEKKRGSIADISAKIHGVEIGINRHLLKDIFALPSSGLKMDELESFGLEELLTTFWGAFIGDNWFTLLVTRSISFGHSFISMISVAEFLKIGQAHSRCARIDVQNDGGHCWK
ncbi:hypothetical protein OROMI_006664 [Orobanche minor]